MTNILLNHKLQPTSSKQIPIIKISNSKPYDLEERTLEFSRRIVRMCRALPKETVNFELMKQGLRSGAAIGANYIEANDALSKKDFVHRLRIARKEAKETVYWLNLIIEANENFGEKIQPLAQEACELKKILSSIIEKSGLKLE